jgi:hypothetical protein
MSLGKFQSGARPGTKWNRRLKFSLIFIVEKWGRDPGSRFYIRFLSSLGSRVGVLSSSAINLVIFVVTHLSFDTGFPSDPTVVPLRVVLCAKVTVSAFATTGTIRVEAVLSFLFSCVHFTVWKLISSRGFKWGFPSSEG